MEWSNYDDVKLEGKLLHLDLGLACVYVSMVLVFFQRKLKIRESQAVC